MTMVRRILWCAAVAGLVLAGVLASVLVPAPGPARAWQASGLTVVAQQEDLFLNYDCTSAVEGDPGACDWPVTIVFWGNASVAKVKQALGSALPIYGVDEYLLLRDKRKRGGWWWVADRGIKSLSLTRAVHLRLYADPDGRLTNGVWGDYVLGTTHLDLNELSKNPTFGYSEDAAADVEAICARAYGGEAVTLDVLPLYNAEAERVEQRPNDKGGVESHVWQCDGLATMVYVP